MLSTKCSKIITGRLITDMVIEKLRSAVQFSFNFYSSKCLFYAEQQLSCTTRAGRFLNP